MSNAWPLAPKSLRPRSLEEILGPEITAQIVGIDLQYRQEGANGSVLAEVHYEVGRSRKAYVTPRRMYWSGNEALE